MTQAAPETLGVLSEEPPPDDPNSAKSREVAGKSPIRIAAVRLRKDKIAMVCLAVVLFFVIIAVFAPLIAKIFGVDTETVLASERIDMLGGGLPIAGPPLHGFWAAHPFGVAPNTGDDNLAYWLYGARTSLTISAASTVIASTVGITLGLLAGFLGGAADKAISFFVDLFLTIPFLLAALTIAPILNQRFNTSPEYPKIQFYNLIGVLAVFGWMGLARLVRGEVLSLREREFVQAARVIGMPTSRILIKELLPNLVAPIVVAISLMLPAFVSAEAGLAYLGIGVTETPDWGRTILLAVPFFETYSLYLIEPLLGIVALVLALNLLGDAVRDALDPKTRR